MLNDVFILFIVYLPPLYLLYNAPLDLLQGGPQKCPYFSLAITFTKIRKSSRFFLQLQEVYRILLVETTLESIMFYYTFSVINTMFVPCTMLQYDSTAATQTLKLSTTLLRISCGIHLISLLMMPSCLWIVFTNSVSLPHFSNRSPEYLRHNFPWDRLILPQINNLWPSYSQDLNLPDYFLRGA